VVVVFGDSISGSGQSSGIGSSYGSFLKPMLAGLFESRISLINSSLPDESYRFAHRRIQADILSFRPDITFVMLGLVDTFTPRILQSTHKENIDNFFSILKESRTFVIVLTTTGLKDFAIKNDPRVQILDEFNEIVRDYARYYHYPLIDVARYMENLRFSKPDEYRSLFSGPFMLNEKGNKYIADCIFQRITKIMGNNFDSGK